MKFKNPSEKEMRCVVHDRVWVFDDILLVRDLDYVRESRSYGRLYIQQYVCMTAGCRDCEKNIL